MSSLIRRIVVVFGSICAVAVVGNPAAAQPGPDAHAIGGQLLTARPLHTAATLPGAAQTTAITYTSTGAVGAPIVVSGTVSVPRTPPPRGGWPTISWAHGTTGYADACAPSRDTRNGLAHDYLGPVTQILDSWVRRGYAVVQTDYEGLGTPGGHPYVNGTSEANTVADIVRAARTVNRGIGRDWVAAGHSQGGQAALFAAQAGDRRQPGLSLKAAIAIAPGGVGLRQTVEYVRSGQPGAEAAQSFLPLIVLGAHVARPSIDPGKVFTSSMDPMMRAAESGCIAQTRSVPTIPSSKVFRPGADVTALTDYLDSQDPVHTAPRVPVMIAQGSADALVAKSGTDGLVTTLCSKSRAVDYRIYEGKDHRASVSASLADSQDFAAAALAGRSAATTCP